jgi:hypothetical protein
MGLNLLVQGGAERAKFIPAGLLGAIPGMSSMATAMMKKKIDKANIPASPSCRKWPRWKGWSWSAAA